MLPWVCAYQGRHGYRVPATPCRLCAFFAHGHCALATPWWLHAYCDDMFTMLSPHPGDWLHAYCDDMVSLWDCYQLYKHFLGNHICHGGGQLKCSVFLDFAFGLIRSTIFLFALLSLLSLSADDMPSL